MVNPLEETDLLQLQSATALAHREQCPETGQLQGQRDLPVSSEEVTEFIQGKKKRNCSQHKSRCRKCGKMA